uniref:Forkhead box protein M1 n=1 Tax=Oncorhynchus mykiss TaxID=8022 RepID=A0A8K9XA10_ONCMY
MRQSPRRPLILRRRKLPFQLNEPAIDEPDGLRHKEASTSKPSGGQCFPDGIRIMDHPTMPGTQVVVIPKTADLQSVIGALTAKGKECGSQGPNKFILLSGGGCIKDGADSFCQSSYMSGLNRDLDCSPLDDSLTNIQWLGRMNTDGLDPDPAKKAANKENHDTCQTKPTSLFFYPLSERPPYSYMAMIQFAINSKKSRRMTLKEIYTWIEDHFPYFRKVAKPGWKNSIRHNLSLHDMFIRETTQDGKISYWTIRPEANRCLTLDQVYKVTYSDASTVMLYAPPVEEMKEEQVCVPLISVTPRAILTNTRKEVSSSRRKQRLVLPSNEEPVLLFPDSTFCDSGLASDGSALQDAELDPRPEPDSPCREFSFKTPIKSSHPASSTPSKPPTVLLEPWRVTPLGKERGGMLDFSPIRTPGPSFTPDRHDHTPFSFSSTPFKDLPLFNSPRELLTSGLVLDTMNDSLSKILVDISFSGLEDDDLGMGNISWSQLIPELK